MFRRYDLQTDILLAVMPAGLMVIVLFLLNSFGKQEILFSSLASSAFLTYLEPEHPTNNVRTLLIAQLSAAVVGYAVYRLIGPGYISAAVSMIVVISIMIVAKAMHPPAVATALVFAFQHAKPNTLLMFFVAVAFVVVLIVLQLTSLWLIKRSTNKKKLHERDS